MSEYGPAFFIKRKDKEDIGKDEQDGLLKQVRDIAKSLGITSACEGELLSPCFYDYDGYEEKAVSFLMYSTDVYSMMPEDIQEDHANMDKDEVQKISGELEKNHPNKYEFDCYFVES